MYCHWTGSSLNQVLIKEREGTNYRKFYKHNVTSDHEAAGKGRK